MPNIKEQMEYYKVVWMFDHAHENHMEIFEGNFIWIVILQIKPT